MSMLNGYDQKDNKTGDIYGEYVHGMVYQTLLNNVEVNKIWIKKDLKLANVFYDLENMTVMDVGTGRQALSIALLGAKKS